MLRALRAAYLRAVGGGPSFLDKLPPLLPGYKALRQYIRKATVVIKFC